MSTVADVISDIRVEINDIDSTRFPNDTSTILPLVKQAIRRANRICQRAELEFAKKSAAYTTVANQNFVLFPPDFEIPIGLWRDDLHTEIPIKSVRDWTQIVSASSLGNAFLDFQNGKILFNAAPTNAIALTFWYFPKLDVSAYTVNDTMPWEGRLDDIISRYVALRIQNIEEQNITTDQAILQDMEASIVSTYAPQSPVMIARDGWL